MASSFKTPVSGQGHYPAPHDLPLPGPKNDLKPTPGKTPMPSKYVTLKKNVKLGAGQILGFTPGKGYYAKPTPPPPPTQRHVSLTPMQQAQLNVKRMLSPQYSQADVEAARQNQAIQAYTTAAMQQLGNVAPQIQGDYQHAADTQAGLVNAAADSLKAANPNGNIQSLLSAIGAPSAQGQQIAGHLGDVFTGGAGVSQYTNALPISALQANGLAATELARLQPGNLALAGRQSLLSALRDQSDVRAKIAGQAPQLLQNQLDTFASNSAKRQQIALENQALGLKQQNTKFNQDLQTAKYNLQVDKQNTTVAKWNQQQKDKSNKIDVGVSKGANDGYAHNSQGAIVYGPNGNPIKFTVATKTKTAGGAPASQVNTFIKGLVTYSHIKGVTTPSGHTMNYLAAYKRLRAPRSQGGYGLNDRTARQFLNGVYKKGEDGRSWFTNQEQATLRKAMKGGYVGIKSHKAGLMKVNLDPVSHNAFLTPIQYRVLKAAGQLPAGSFKLTPIGERWYIAQ